MVLIAYIFPMLINEEIDSVGSISINLMSFDHYFFDIRSECRTDRGD